MPAAGAANCLDQFVILADGIRTLQAGQAFSVATGGFRGIVANLETKTNYLLVGKNFKGFPLRWGSASLACAPSLSLAAG